MAGKQSCSSAGGTAEPSDEMDNEGIDTYFKVSQTNCTDWLSKYPQVIRKVQLFLLLLLIFPPWLVVVKLEE